MNPFLTLFLLNPCIWHCHLFGDQLDANIFRTTRLYHEDVDILLQEHSALLHAIFNHYRQLANACDDK